MTNHNVFLKYQNSQLEYSTTESGTYSPVEAHTVMATVWDNDTVTFSAVDGGGISKLISIDDGLNGTDKLIKTKSNTSDKSIVATIIGNCQANQVDKFDIKFKPDNGNTITVDPELKTKQDGRS